MDLDFNDLRFDDDTDPIGEETNPEEEKIGSEDEELDEWSSEQEGE